MDERKVTTESMERFEGYLQREERGEGTIEKYLRDVRALRLWADGTKITKETVVAWKKSLQQQGYAAVTINSMLAAVNSFFRFMGWEDCCVRSIRLQRRMFREPERELTREEYQRLLGTARARGQERLALLMETICATGIRVSEVPYITVEAVQKGRADISLKGKIRTILLPGKLCQKLRKYARKQKVVSGEIFLTRNGKGLSRKQIWAEMKKLCKAAGIEPDKVFPHNLRHLFARIFYKTCRDVAKLADILGHSSIETTRIYLVSTGTEHVQQLERLNLIC